MLNGIFNTKCKEYRPDWTKIQIYSSTICKGGSKILMLEWIYMQDTHPRLQKRGWWRGSIWPPPWPSPESPAPPHLGHHHLFHSLNLFRCNQRNYYFEHKCTSLHLNNQSYWIPLERYIILLNLKKIILKFIAQKRFKSRWASLNWNFINHLRIISRSFWTRNTIEFKHLLWDY